MTAAFCLTASADNIKFGHMAPPFHGQAKAADAFAAHVKEKTQGRIDITTFPTGQLGGERSMAGNPEPLRHRPGSFRHCHGLNIQMGMLPPPFGLNLFVASGITKAPLLTIARGVAPFLAIMLACLMLVTYIPWISLALPGWILR